jgi:hypothetical protein
MSHQWGMLSDRGAYQLPGNILSRIRTKILCQDLVKKVAAHMLGCIFPRFCCIELKNQTVTMRAQLFLSIVIANLAYNFHQAVVQNNENSKKAQYSINNINRE